MSARPSWRLPADPACGQIGIGPAKAALRLMPQRTRLVNLTELVLFGISSYNKHKQNVTLQVPGTFISKMGVWV